MCIERNRDILFWVRAKSRVSRYVRNCGGMQLVLPNPTTVAIPAAAGLVHLWISCRRNWLLSSKAHPPRAAPPQPPEEGGAHPSGLGTRTCRCWLRGFRMRRRTRVARSALSSPGNAGWIPVPGRSYHGKWPDTPIAECLRDAGGTVQPKVLVDRCRVFSPKPFPFDPKASRLALLGWDRDIRRPLHRDVATRWPRASGSISLTIQHQFQLGVVLGNSTAALIG
jgi:hypothetical protein